MVERHEEGAENQKKEVIKYHSRYDKLLMEMNSEEKLELHFLGHA